MDKEAFAIGFQAGLVDSLEKTAYGAIGGAARLGAIGGGLGAGGDVIHQKLEGKKDIDWKRALKRGAIGATGGAIAGGLSGRYLAKSREALKKSKLPDDLKDKTSKLIEEANRDPQAKKKLDAAVDEMMSRM